MGILNPHDLLLCNNEFSNQMIPIFFLWKLDGYWTSFICPQRYFAVFWKKTCKWGMPKKV